MKKVMEHIFSYYPIHLNLLNCVLLYEYILFDIYVRMYVSMCLKFKDYTLSFNTYLFC